MLFSQNGALQLMVCPSGGSGVRELSLIPMGIDGYPVPMLKEVCKSSIVYIQSMQTNISLDKAFSNPSDEAVGNASTLCLHCKGDIEFNEFEDHIAK